MRSAVIVFLALATACTHADQDQSAPANASSAAAFTPPTVGEPIAKTTGKVLATLVTNNAKVSILSGQRVVVRNTDGTIVADGISVDELAAVDPLLHVLVRSAVASNDGEYVDARLDRQPRNIVHAGF